MTAVADAAAAAAARVPEVGTLSLRATYRLRVGDEVCGELIRATVGMAPPTRWDPDGLRQDLAHLLGALREVRELGHYGLQESLISAAALRAASRLYPHAGDAVGSHDPVAAEARGFHYGSMAGLSDQQCDLLGWATEGPYRAYLEDRTRSPTPEQELAACSLEAGWLAGAFAKVEEEEAARACRRVAEDLCIAVQEITEVVRVVGRFEEHRPVAFRGGYCVITEEQVYAQNHSRPRQD